MCDTRNVFSPNFSKIKLSAQLTKDVDEWLSAVKGRKIKELPFNVHKGKELSST